MREIFSILCPLNKWGFVQAIAQTEEIYFPQNKVDLT